MTELYLIRHAQAEGNLYRMMQGQWDGDVTRLGSAQIEALGERFRDIPLDAIISSDLYRAAVTAEGIRKHHANLSILYDDRLREIDLGPWTARFVGDLMYEREADLQRFLNDGENWRISGAETFAEVRDRAFRCLEEIAAAHEGQKIAVVSHGVTIRCILWRMLGIRLQETAALPACQNTAVTKLVFEKGHFRTEEINCAEHLQKLAVPTGQKIPNLRGERFDPARDPDFYTRCYADAWETAHGSLRGFDPMVYLDRAKKHHAVDADAVLRICNGQESAGLIDLDPERGKKEGWGWISLLYLRAEYRHSGCGPQLLGRALVGYEKQGRTAVRLSVAEQNCAALAFYEKNGFVCIEEAGNAQGKILYMERKLGRRKAFYGTA